MASKLQRPVVHLLCWGKDVQTNKKTRKPVTWTEPPCLFGTLRLAPSRPAWPPTPGYTKQHTSSVYAR